MYRKQISTHKFCPQRSRHSPRKARRPARRHASSDLPGAVILGKAEFPAAVKPGRLGDVDDVLELICGRETLPPSVGNDPPVLRDEEGVGVEEWLEEKLLGDDSGGVVKEGLGMNSEVGVLPEPPPPPPPSKSEQDRSVQHSWIPSKMTQINPGLQCEPSSQH